MPVIVYDSTIKDIKRLLEEGVDEYWWTIEEEGNYALINRLRKLVGLDELSEKDLKECQERWDC